MRAQLTELMGLKGSVGKRCIVMGLISTQEDGRLSIEDESATVPIDLSHATMHAGLVTGGLDWYLLCSDIQVTEACARL